MRMMRMMSLPGLVALVLLPSAIVGMKHNFRETKGPSLIGPVGPPFGFNARGHFGLMVYDFALTVKEGHSDTVMDEVEPGFFLVRYPNEAYFNQHMEMLRSNTSSCSFEHFYSGNDFRGSMKAEYGYGDVGDDEFDMYGEDDLMDNFDDFLAMDDDWEYESEIISADHGVFLSMKNKKKNWKPATPSIEYDFKA